MTKYRKELAEKNIKFLLKEIEETKRALKYYQERIKEEREVLK